MKYLVQALVNLYLCITNIKTIKQTKPLNQSWNLSVNICVMLCRKHINFQCLSAEEALKPVRDAALVSCSEK